jgi:RNA polymerase sigma factor (sigma-70 family)
MQTAEATSNLDEPPAVPVVVGDPAFAQLASCHRPWLQAHCYRMLGSVEDSEDAVQETFLRAWRSRRTLRDRSSVRSWLRRIATNTCLDALRRRPHCALLDEPQEVGRMFERLPAPEPEPEAVIVARDTFELTLAAVRRHLTPRQRAALILRGVFDMSAKDSALLLEASVPSVNSALQRARSSLRDRLPEGVSDE